MRRERARTAAAHRSLGTMIGFPLICPIGACVRAGRCADPKPGLPLCATHYRGTLRFLLALVGRLQGEGAIALSDEGAPEAEGEPLLAVMERRGLARLAALRRPREAGRCAWAYETDPTPWRHFGVDAWPRPTAGPAAAPASQGSPGC